MSSTADPEPVDTLERAAIAAARAGDTARAIGLVREAAATLRQGVPPDVPGAAANHAARLAGLGMLWCALQHWTEARELLGEAEAAFAALPDVPVSCWGRRMQALGALATAHRFGGDPARAADAIAAGAAWAEAAVAGSADHGHRFEVAQLRNAVGDALLDAGRSEEARLILSVCAGDIARLAGDTGAAGLHNLHAAVLNKLGRAELAAGEPSAALGRFEQSVAIMRHLVENEGHDELQDDLQAATADLHRLRADITS
jgi:tetratricopeptide (TPR) repeat protein